MDCNKIKQILDKYIDKELPDKLMKEVRMHLSTCKECSAELKYLQRLRKEFKTTAPVKAPSDFLVQLNRRIDKQESGSILKKIFFPLKIKLPLEAAGVLVTLLLIVIFFFPEKELKESLPVFEKAAYVEDNEKEFRIAKTEKPGVAVKRSDESFIAGKAKKIETRSIADFDDEKKKIVRTYDIVMLLQRPEKEDKMLKFSEKAERDYSSAGAPSVSKSESAPEAAAEQSAEEVASDAVREEAPARAKAGAAKKISQANKIDKKQILVSSVEEAINTIKDAVAAMNGRIVSSGISDKDNNINYIVVEIPAENSDKFVNDISRFGKLKLPAEKVKDITKQKNLRYKINISTQ